MIMEYLGAFLIGFLGSVHCLGMCGPIAFALPLGRSSGWNKLIGGIVYSFGKIVSYLSLGLVFGLMGKVLVLMKLQQYLSIVVGTVLILSVFPLFKGILNSNFRWSSKYIQPIKLRISQQFARTSAASLLTIGLFNGLLPCGLVYIGLAAALAMGEPLQSALFMGIFGLGTSPMLIAVIFSKSLIKKKAYASLKKAIPLMIVFMGCLLIVRGLNLGLPYLSPKVYHQSESVECH